ncbi:hypothetical protein N9R43_00600 [bacterium]|nr:hypothetical protein [bacterium]
MKINEIISENFAGAFAGVNMSLGGGDPAASIYAKKPASKKKKTKPQLGYSADAGNLAYKNPVKSQMIKR